MICLPAILGVFVRLVNFESSLFNLPVVNFVCANLLTLAKALKRGVSVYLGYGYQSASEPAPLKKHEIEAEENLLALKEWCADKDTDGILVVKKFPNHSKILICDDAYAVNGSFNWLSNAGRSRNIERSWLIKDKEFINTEIELILSELARHVNKRDFLKHFVPWSRH